MRFAAVAFVLVSAISSTRAADYPQGADALTFRENGSSTQARALWLTRTPPPALPASDPRIVGATLRIVGLDQDSLFVLPPERWTLDGSGTRYRFKDVRTAPGRPAPIREVVIEQGKRLKVAGLSERIDLDDAAPATVSILLEIGAETYCATCTTPLATTAGKYRARECTAPPSCPVLPPPPCGTFVTKWGRLGSHAGEFDYIYGVATDGNRNVYVVDRANRRVQHFDGSGLFIGQWGSQGTGDGQFELPSDVWVEAAGTVLVADVAANRIQRFTSDGVYLAQWGSLGAGDGQLNGPYGLATDASGAVYVADTFNHRIQKFDGTGVFVGMWGWEGSGDGQFEGPYSLATDAGGRVLVADGAGDRVQVFTGDGDFIAAWGTTGSADGQLVLPDGIAVASDGRVYVADRGNERIQLFLCP